MSRKPGDWWEFDAFVDPDDAPSRALANLYLVLSVEAIEKGRKP
jgi:hypothetical protein